MKAQTRVVKMGGKCGQTGRQQNACLYADENNSVEIGATGIAREKGKLLKIVFG